MAEAAEIKDPAVAVHLAKIEGKLEAVKVSNDQLSSQLSTMLAHLQDIARLSIKSEAQDANFARVWGEFDKRDLRYEHGIKRLESVERQSNKIIWFTGGVSFASGLLIAVLMWVANSLVQDVKNLDTRSDRLEIYNAGPKVEPFKR